MNSIKETIGLGVGSAVGGFSGVYGSIATVSALGYPGLSAAGITSGLCTLGGGSMVTGLVVATGGTGLLVVGIGGLGFYIGKKWDEWFW